MGDGSAGARDLLRAYLSPRGLPIYRPASRCAGLPAVLRVVDQRAQRAPRAVRAGVAEAPLLADAERAAVAVVAVAVHELGGAEHGLLVALGGLARGLREAAVLALVVRDDPLEAVVGIELPRLEHV